MHTQTEHLQGGERSRWLVRFGWPRVLGLLVLLALTLLKYSDPAPLETLRLALFDQAMMTHPRAATDSPVVIVDLDETSLARIGQWPWSRGGMARLGRPRGMPGPPPSASTSCFPSRTGSRPNTWRRACRA